MGTINADFSGETAVVTGASSGIGRAVANGFGDAGATVINADVRAAPKDLDAEAPHPRGHRGPWRNRRVR